MHTLRKLVRTVRMLATLFMAQTFGRYEVSVWNGEFGYHRYHWRGKVWAVPSSPIEMEAE